MTQSLQLVLELAREWLGTAGGPGDRPEGDLPQAVVDVHGFRHCQRGVPR